MDIDLTKENFTRTLRLKLAKKEKQTKHKLWMEYLKTNKLK